jgi:hypothetical protein
MQYAWWGQGVLLLGIVYGYVTILNLYDIEGNGAGGAVAHGTTVFPL